MIHSSIQQVVSYLVPRDAAKMIHKIPMLISPSVNVLR